MGHAVHYRTNTGETRFEEAESLDAALAKVERLRNDDGVSDVRVYREVPIAFKTYYKVTVAGEESGGEGVAEAPTAVVAEPAPAPAAPAPAPAMDAPPPGAMPLAPAKVSEELLDGDGDDAKRGSLFSRG